MNEENLRKLYERLGIAESSASPPPPPLPAPVSVAEPPIVEPLPEEPRRLENAPSTLGRLAETRVTLSLPVLILSIGAIVGGLVLISQVKGPGSTPKPPVATAPSPGPRPVGPPVAPPVMPPTIPDPPPPTPPVAPPSIPPAPPPPPELTAAEKRAARIRSNGGNEDTEAAVARALDWLARHQAETGEWEAMHFERKCPRAGSCQVKEAPGDKLYTPGVTALALLAFMGAGHSSTEGPYTKTLSLGLAWLIERQNSEGAILEGKRVLFYNHAVATRALCEATRLTGDPRFQSAAQKALDYLGRTQNADGGWSYYRDAAEPERNDASITGWVAFAVRAAEEAGLTVPAEMRGRIRDLFGRRTVNGTAEVQYTDREPGAGRRGSGLVGLGLFVRGRLGEDDADLSRRAVERLLAARPDWDLFLSAQIRSGAREFPFNPDQNFAGWYYGTEGMFRRGGEEWVAWNEALRAALVNHQVREGHPGGSWEPETSYIGREGGRVFSTAIAALMLTIYARER